MEDIYNGHNVYDIISDEVTMSDIINDTTVVLHLPNLDY